VLFQWVGNHEPYPEMGFDNKLKNWVLGGCELQFTFGDTVFREFDSTGPLRFKHTEFIQGRV
jgi:hypothetical protein